MLTVRHSLDEYIPLISNRIDIDELEELAAFLSNVHSTFKLSCSTTALLTGGLAMAKQEQITQGCSPTLEVFCKGPPDSSSPAQIIGITKEKSTYDS